MRCPQCSVLPRRQEIWFHLRRNFPPAHDRQGTQPRHGVVFDDRQRVATGAPGLRPLARPCKLRSCREAEGEAETPCPPSAFFLSSWPKLIRPTPAEDHLVNHRV